MTNDDGILERIFSEAEGLSDVRRLAGQSLWARSPRECNSRVADIAAHLDSASASRDEQQCVSELAHDPGAADELEAAEAWLTRIGTENQPVPETLLRLVGAKREIECVVESPGALIPRKPARVWSAAIAASLIAGVAGYAARDFIAVKTLPVASIQPGKSAATPQKFVPNNPVATVQQKPAGMAKPEPRPTVTTPNAPIALSPHAVTADDYPAESVQSQEQGTVNVRYLVQKDGTVGDCQVELSSGFPRLDDAACALVKRWLFRPATVIGGTPVAVYLTAAIVFQLK